MASLVHSTPVEDHPPSPKRQRRGAFSAEQQRALDYAQNGMSFFLTGAAGTGKSSLVKEILCVLEDNDKRVAITASTGAAAQLIGGRTLHSFSGLGRVEERDTPEELATKVRGKLHALQTWMNTDVLLIDEISMISARLFEQLEYVARKVRGKEKPFGGIQVIAVGDFLQLAPIKGTYAYMCEMWNQTIASRVVLLTHVYRQSDPTFIQGLHQIRKGVLTPSFLQAVEASHRNGAQESERVGTAKQVSLEVEYTKLYCTRDDVNAYNRTKLLKLPGKLHTFLAKDFKTDPRIDLDGLMVDGSLDLKVGAQVVFLKNTALFQNGTRGVVVEVVDVKNRPAGEGKIWVQLVNGERIMVAPIAFEMYQNKRIIASRTCLPLKLGWAITIHKSQGMTLDRVEVDLSKVFSYAQAYTALSRAMSLASLRVVGLHQRVVYCHPDVCAYYNLLELENTTRMEREQDAAEREQEEEAAR